MHHLKVGFAALIAAFAFAACGGDPPASQAELAAYSACVCASSIAGGFSDAEFNSCESDQVTYYQGQPDSCAACVNAAVENEGHGDVNDAACAAMDNCDTCVR